MLVDWLFEFALWLDRKINLLLGGQWPETISCRLARRTHTGCQYCRFMCQVLDWFDPQHCHKSLAFYSSKKEE